MIAGRFLAGGGRVASPRRVLIAAMLSLGVVGLAACGSGSTTGGGGSGGDNGGELRLATQQEPQTLASWGGFATDGYPVIRNVEEALINRDPETNELVGELATSWKSTSPTTWEFQLREGVKFHDGSDFNAEAAAYSLNYTLSPDQAFVIRQFLGPDVEFEASGEYTLVATTTEPDPILPTRLYFVPIVSAKLLQETPEDYETKPVGTGPYKFVSWSRGQNIKLEVNTDWWGREDPEAAGGSNTDITSATFVFPTDSSVRAANVKTGEADFASWLTREECETVPTCLPTAGIETLIVRLDTPCEPLSDIRVREAIALSFSKEQIMEDLVGGTPTAQIAGPSALGYNPDLQPFPQDVDRAKQLIAEAKADGVDVDTPLHVQATIGVNPHASEIVQYIAQSMREIGLNNVDTEMRNKEDFEQDWTSGYDAISPTRCLVAMSQHGNELMDYSSSVQSYYSCDSLTSAWCDPALDKQIAAALPLTGDERDQALQALAKEVYDKIPIIPLGQPNFFYGTSENLEWKPRLDGFILFKEMKFKG
jgi:peptide/nickel transport system substrate-binding protein